MEVERLVWPVGKRGVRISALFLVCTESDLDKEYENSHR